jgi:hypothetical protein
MAKTKVSLGGYHLKKYDEYAGRDFKAFTVDLHHNDRLIAHLEDKGDGGMIQVNFSRDIMKQDAYYEKYFDFVLKDMELLIKTLGDTVERHASCYTFTNTPYSAAEGFTELLLELKQLSKLSIKAYKQLGDKAHYAVGSRGHSWFKKGFSIHGESNFCFAVNTLDPLVAYANAITKLSESYKENGEVVSLAVLKGEMDWNLDFASFADLHRP